MGQPDFSTATPGDEKDKLYAPSAVAVGSNGWVYVADAVNNRILVFKPPFRSGMPADSLFGDNFRIPISVEIDPDGRGIWVNDFLNHMIELWNWEGTAVTKVLGKEEYLPNGGCNEGWFPDIPAHICSMAGGIGFDTDGNALAVHSANEVFRFPHPLPDVGIVRGPDRRLFFPPDGSNLLSDRVLSAAPGVAVFGDQLIVADDLRLMFWNEIRNLSTGKPADGVLGARIYEPRPTCCGRIKVDTSGRLWVTGFEGRHVLDVYQLPLTERSVPILSLTPGSSSFPVLGTEERIILGESIHGVQPIGKSEFVWLSDTDNHRVVRIRNPLTDPMVDVILGQLKPQGTKCNRHEGAQAQDLANRGHEVYDSPSPSMICFPGALSLDRFGNLYVSDHTIEVAGNYRLLVFSADLFHPEDSQTLFAPLATKVFSKHRTRYFQDEFVRWRGRPRDWSVSTWEPTFDSQNRMVVGYNAYGGGRFVGFYEDPLSADTNPSGYLYDFSSQPYSATFDENDNLYIGDINRGRVLIYWNPFNNTPQPAKPVAPQESAEEGPLPAYPVTIKSVTPSPPYCVMRQSCAKL